MSLGLAAVNQAVKEGKAAQTLRVLRLPEVALRSVVDVCAAGYQAELSALLRAKAAGGRHSHSPPTVPSSMSPFVFHVNLYQPITKDLDQVGRD